MTGTAVTLFDLNGEQRFTGTQVGGGGAQPSTLNAVLTLNRAGSFAAEHIFDFGHPTTPFVVFTVSSLVADGETWGTAPGDIQVVTTDTVSNGGISWQSGQRVSENANMVAVNDTENVATFTGQYLKVSADIEDDAFSPYVGANNPVAVVAVAVTYL